MAIINWSSVLTALTPPTAEETLEKKIEQNPYYPFVGFKGNGELIVQLADGQQSCATIANCHRLIRIALHFTHNLSALEFSVRYTILYVAIATCVLSIVLLIFVFTGNLSSNAFFILPLITLIVSIAGIWNYKDTRYYTLLPSQKEYLFAHDKKVHVRGEYYNIYVRLRREVRSGKIKYYHLVLNGYQIDSRQLSGTSKNVEKLRKLGQRIAANLNLNYFDEANTSQHHVIRHFRSDKQVFSFRQGSKPVKTTTVVGDFEQDPKMLESVPRQQQQEQPK